MIDREDFETKEENIAYSMGYEDAQQDALEKEGEREARRADQMMKIEAEKEKTIREDVRNLIDEWVKECFGVCDLISLELTDVEVDEMIALLKKYNFYYNGRN
jgi:hypothetical protein